VGQQVVTGNPDPKHISISYAERQNLTMRMQMRRFTRLTNAFSKKFENHVHMVALYGLVQFDEDPQGASDVACHGGRDHRVAVEHGGYCLAGRGGCAAAGAAWAVQEADFKLRHYRNGVGKAHRSRVD
jgi:hypothetical protein